MTPEEIARVCHEANRAVTHVVNDVPVQPPWDEYAPELQQAGLRGVAYALLHPEATSEESHRAWCEERWASGWVFGTVRDEKLKTHPALRPYNELSEGTRRKDALFHAIVRALR